MGKRIKTVFSNSEQVARIYAAQSQDSARCKNTSFDGRDLWSYGHHYLLARIGITFGKRKVAVANFTEYSRTTSGHSWEARRILEEAGYTVLSVRCDSGKIKYGISDNDLKALAIEELSRSASSLREIQGAYAKSGAGPWYISDLRKEIKEHNELVQFLGLPLRDFKVRIDEAALKAAVSLSKKRECALADISSRIQEWLDLGRVA